MDFQFELPVDEDGFIDRSCPVCEMPFRWHHGPIGDIPVDAIQNDDYTCPYCGVASPVDQWWTTEQVENLQKLAASKMLPELMADLDASTKSLSDNGLIEVKVSGPTMYPPSPLFLNEDHELVGVLSPCHPYEPIKVLSSWQEPVHCLVCGQLFQIPRPPK